VDKIGGCFLEAILHREKVYKAKINVPIKIAYIMLL
jgi:hypothetical protein